jgi:Na+/proline symporter
MVSRLHAAGESRRLALVPLGEDALVPMSTFLGYIGIQWWAFRNSDGGGVFVQRLSSTANEREAAKAAHTFNILNYLVRTWPWVIVGLAALVLMPGLADPETAYPLMMLRYLPAGLLGLVFASLLAAFMSTVSTQLNWGASYLVHDLYARFTGQADDRRLLRAARVASVLLALLAATVSFFMESVGQVFRFLILIGNGPGLVLLLRWFWWRINAWAEIAAMLAGLALALLTFLPPFDQLTFGWRLVLTGFGSMLVWVPAMLLTKPEAPEVLDQFYARVRPAGAWGPVQARVQLPPLDSLAADARRWLLWVVIVLGGMLGIGWVLLT